jgi:NDP-sugar pyrophosphorylase family protein
MEKKYILTNDTRVVRGKKLYRIKAIKNFDNVKKGSLGGYIEKEENLSHAGKCWIYGDAYVLDNAMVFDNAKVYDDACIYDNARIYDNAVIYGNAHIFGNVCVYNTSKVYGQAHIYDNIRIYDNAQVYGRATICGNTKIFDNAQVYGSAYIRGYARIFGNASIYGSTYVYGNTCICDNACVYDNAHVFGEAYISGNARIFDSAYVYGDIRVFGNAIVCEHAKVQFSQLKTDIRKDLKASLKCQCNLIPENDKVVAYKLVHKSLRSLYDMSFVYKIGETAICKNPKEDNSSCSAGLHFSNLTYWDNKTKDCLDNLVYLKAEIDLGDIITIQDGKIRCRKAKILDKIEID